MPTPESVDTLKQWLERNSFREHVAEHLKRDFGYVEEPGDKWVVYQSRLLIVVHPERLIRCYRYRSGTTYFEIDPSIGLGAL